MGSLRSGIDELRATDLAACQVGRIEADLSEIRAAIGGLQAECARRLAELERRSSFERDGHLSMTSWVEARFGVGWSEAAREVRLARGLEHMPSVRDALAEGTVAASTVGRLVEAREADPAAFARAESQLVDAAQTLPARVFQRTVERWKAETNAARTGREEAERFERRGLSVAPAVDGMVRVDGSLDPDTGGTVMTALRAVTAAWARSADDARSPAQRRADALGEICRMFLDGTDRVPGGVERPHISVVVDLDTLRGVGGKQPDSSEGTVLSAGAVRRLACDAAVSRVIVRGPSEPLDVGRTTRVVPPALRRALAVRDGGCAFPSCDRPVGWCDAHHVRHWVDGGRTALSNLVMLCRRHHTLTHSGFRVAMAGGRPVFRRPDGTALGGRPVALDVARATSQAGSASVTTSASPGIVMSLAGPANIAVADRAPP